MIKKYMLLLIKRFHESKSINNKRLYDGILFAKLLILSKNNIIHLLLIFWHAIDYKRYILWPLHFIQSLYLGVAYEEAISNNKRYTGKILH